MYKGREGLGGRERGMVKGAKGRELGAGEVEGGRGSQRERVGEEVREREREGDEVKGGKGGRGIGR